MAYIFGVKLFIGGVAKLWNKNLLHEKESNEPHLSYIGVMHTYTVCTRVSGGMLQRVLGHLVC